MDINIYEKCGDELLEKIWKHTEQVRIPGECAYRAGQKMKKQKQVNISKQTMLRLQKLYRVQNPKQEDGYERNSVVEKTNENHSI